MSDLEQYLKQATRGLWGRERRAVRAELLGHIHQRAQELQLGGLNQTEAERLTLRELGAPAQVARGMAGVYALPVLTRTGLALAASATLLLGALPQGLAQVQAVFATTSGNGAAAYLDLEQLRAELAKGGARLTGPFKKLVLQVPGARGPAAVDTSSWPGATLQQQQRAFISTNSILIALQNTGADLRLSGWAAPTLRANGATLQIRTGGDRRLANELYGAALQSSWPDFGDGGAMSILEPNGGTEESVFSGPFQSGQVYALITPTFNDWSSRRPDGSLIASGNILLIMDANVPDANGRLRLRRYASGTPAFRLTTDVGAFQAALKPYMQEKTKLHQWSEAHPAPALLLNLSGRFGRDAYTVVAPGQVQVGP